MCVCVCVCVCIRVYAYGFKVLRVLSCCGDCSLKCSTTLQLGWPTGVSRHVLGGPTLMGRNLAMALAMESTMRVWT